MVKRLAGLNSFTFGSQHQRMETSLIKKKKIKFSSSEWSSCKVVYEEGLPNI
jgi:hypothetical protein